MINKLTINLKNFYRAFIKNNMPKNFIKATYDNKMYDSLKLALVRPGIGTLTDLLNHKIKIISYYEKIIQR